MAVPVFDAVTIDDNAVADANRSSGSFSHTTSGTNRTLLVYVFLRVTAVLDPAVSTLTYNGIGMTFEGANVLTISGNQKIACELWSLVNPASGANTVAFTYNQTMLSDAVVAVSYENTDQSDPIGPVVDASGTTGDPTVNITTLLAGSLISSAAMVLDGTSDPFTPGTGITERWDLSTNGAANDLAYTGGDRPATLAGLFTMTFAPTVQDVWCIVAAEINGFPEPVTSDGVVNYAAQVGLIKDTGVNEEASQGIQEDKGSNLEALQGVLKDTGAVMEAGAGIASDHVPNMESLVGILENGIVNEEALQGIQEDVVSNFEALLGVQKDAGSNVEAAGTAQKDASPNFESLVGLTRDEVAAFESLLGITKDAGSNVEAGQGIVGDGTVNVEALRGILKDAGVNFEALRGILKDAGVNFEALQGILKDAGVNYEALQSAFKDAGVNYEALQGVLKDAGVNVEALGTVIQDGPVNFEALITVIKSESNLNISTFVIAGTILALLCPLDEQTHSPGDVETLALLCPLDEQTHSPGDVERIDLTLSLGE